jgi:hypothetical protein
VQDAGNNPLETYTTSNFLMVLRFTSKAPDCFSRLSDVLVEAALDEVAHDSFHIGSF